MPLGESGRVRKFISDGNTVVMKEWVEGKDGRVEFGLRAEKVLPSLLPGEKVGPPPTISLSGDD
jgi:hypothetical protein